MAGRTATLHGDATFGLGLVGQAFELDGEDDFVSVPTIPRSMSEPATSPALWVNFVATDGQQILVEKWVQRFLEPEIVSGWTLTKLPDNHVSFAVAERTYVEVDSAPLDIPLHTWVHFAARRGAARRRGDTIQILMNGDVIASHTAPNAGTLDPDSLSSIKFGHRGDPCDTPGSVSDQGFFLNGLNGRIDEVKFRYRAGPVEPGDPGDSGEGGRRKALLVDERAAAATPNR